MSDDLDQNNQVEETTMEEVPEVETPVEEVSDSVVLEGENRPIEPETETDSIAALQNDKDEDTQSPEPEQQDPASDTQVEPTQIQSDSPISQTDDPNAKWYVVHTYSGHENKVSTALKQRVESEHLEHKIFDILVPTQEKIEIRSGKKTMVKEKIFPGYILVKMILDDNSWLAVRTTQGVTAFIGMGNKPTPIPEQEVSGIVKFMTQGAAPTFGDVFLVDDTVKIIDGPFAEFIGKVDSVDKEHGKVRVLVSIFGRETPVELDFLQVTKL